METKLRFKVGDKVRIIAQNKADEHHFKIGEEVTISVVLEENHFHDYYAESSKGEYWAIDEISIEPIEPSGKIKGYRLKEECEHFHEAAKLITSMSIIGCKEVFENSMVHEDLKEAGVMHWFEPVYEEPEFTAKKGEWVVVTEAQFIDSDGFTIGKAYQLREDFIFRKFLVVRDDSGSTTNGYRQAPDDMKFRHATPEEIAKAKEGETKVITMRCEGGTFEIEVSKRGIYYRPEKAWINIANIREAISSKKVGNQSTASGFFIFKPTMIDAGCKKGTYVSDWEKVIEECERICKF